MRLRRLLTTSVLAACAGAGDSSGRDAGTMVAALGSDPGHLNPAITTNGGVHYASGLLFNGLLTVDSMLAPQPELAERWEVLDDGARYRFHLRRDVRWHDGRPFTAADVKFTFDEMLLKFHARTRASLGPALVAVDAPDDSTVEFRFRRPYAPLLRQLDVVEAPILPRHVFGGGDPLRHPANLRPIGTGPFRFTSYATNGEIRYAANREYFRGRPALEHVVLRVIPDHGTQAIALEAGEVDWLFSVHGPERERLQRDPRMRFIRTALNPGGSNCIATLGFNLDRAMFRDVRVRRAIAHALNREQYLERVSYGDGRVADAPISSRIAFAHASGLPVPGFDTARAAELLVSAGWQREGDERRRSRRVRGVKDGTELVIRLVAQTGQMAAGDLLRAQLRTLGIDLRIELLEQAVFSPQVFGARDFDVALVSYCNGLDPEIGVRRQYVSSSIGPVPFSNLAAYRNPVMDSLFDLAGASVDSEVRRRLYREIQEIAVRDQPYVWLVETLGTRVHTTRCSDFGSASHFAATARCAR